MTTSEQEAARLRAHFEHEAEGIHALAPMADAARRRGKQLRSRRRLALGGSVLAASALAGGLGIIADQQPNTRTNVAGASDSVELTVMTDPDGVNIRFHALMYGQLLISDEGCPTILRESDGAEVGAVWPDGWTARRGDDGVWAVIDASGELRAADGALISAGGGPSYWDETTCGGGFEMVLRISTLEVR